MGRFRRVLVPLCWFALPILLGARRLPAEQAPSSKQPTAELRVLLTDDATPSLRDVLASECDQAFSRRGKARDAVKTADDVGAWQAERRQFFLRQLGEFPARTPLAATTVGRLAGEGYRIEKIVFESQPHHHLTATLYLPDAPPPYPGVIVPCGHGPTGKATATYQQASILLALNGIAALCYDPIGQGERSQMFGLSIPKSAAEPAAGQAPPAPLGPTSEHTLMGVGAILVGRNTATYRIYDGMRALDYLASRPDIDPRRLGCTGNSGGGTLTAYLMALDERIVCAAPSCYLTTFARLLDQKGPQDAEQNIFGQIAFGMDQADYVLMRAPKPTCILSAKRDEIFDIAGAWEVFREAKQFYGRLGHPERVDLVEADEPHGFSMPLRVGAVRWMRRWLLDRDDAITEPDFAIRTDRELFSTPDGQVMRLPGELSVFDLNRQEAERLAKLRSAGPEAKDARKLMEAVRATIGVAPLEDLPELSSKKVGTIQRDGYRIEKLLLGADEALPLPALAFIPQAPDGDVYLYLDGEGKEAASAADGPIEQLVHQGHLVLAVDLRGCGETARGANASQRTSGQRAGRFGPEVEPFFLAYLLGKSLVGIRTEDALRCERFLATFERPDGQTRRIHVVGVGSAGLPALHAAAIAPEQIATLTLRRSLRTWRDLFDTADGGQYLGETVHGALQVYDLPDLVRLAGTERVVQEEPLLAD